MPGSILVAGKFPLERWDIIQIDPFLGIPAGATNITIHKHG